MIYLVLHKHENLYYILFFPFLFSLSEYIVLQQFLNRLTMTRRWFHFICRSVTLTLVICYTEAFAVCENYSPPEGFNPKDLHRLLEKVGSPSGGDDLGKWYPTGFCLFINFWTRNNIWLSNLHFMLDIFSTGILLLERILFLLTCLEFIIAKNFRYLNNSFHW